MSEKSQTTTIYILELQDNHYYIGKSSRVQERIQEHFSGQGSGWTRRYPPIRIERIIEEASPLDEDKWTKEYMIQYGVERVRGGTYVLDILENSQIEALNREIWAARDCCTNCGRRGHYAKDCRARRDTCGNVLQYIWQCDICHKEFVDERKCVEHEAHCGKRQCYRCGKWGHIAKHCYSKKDIHGNPL